VADALTVDTSDTTRLVASLDKAARALADPDEVLRKVTALVASRATPPRRTGALAGSLHVSSATVEGNPAAELTWGVRYAAYVNFGTRTMTARPFATDALAATAADAGPLLAQWADTIVAGVDG
jgi:hypothetical protein